MFPITTQRISKKSIFIILFLLLILSLNRSFGFIPINYYHNTRRLFLVSSRKSQIDSICFSTSSSISMKPEMDELTTNDITDKTISHWDELPLRQFQDDTTSDYQYSLAGPFLVVATKRKETNGQSLEYEWSLLPIETIISNDNKTYGHSEGIRAWAALHRTDLKRNIENVTAYRLTANVAPTTTKTTATTTTIPSEQVNDEANIMSSTQASIEISTRSNYDNNDNNNNTNHNGQQLIEVLSRIMVQWAARQYLAEIDIGKQSQTVRLTFVHNAIRSNHTTNVTEVSFIVPSSILLFQDNKDTNNDDINRAIQLNLFSSDDTVSSEMVEMVDQHGKNLGRVPRTLVHKFNLLHRGIGIFVTRDHPIQLLSEESTSHYNIHDDNGDNDNDPSKQQAQPDLYVHQRSHDKSIFPSLYDMFVGGVSLAGEDSFVTAKREIAEELGLRHAVIQNDDETSRTRFIGPILHCIVCTAYNRCYVDLYSYTMDTSLESISWQSEEVAWGSFVPYNIICAAADLSIQRLANTNQWPGRYPPIQSKWNGHLIQTSRSNEPKDELDEKYNNYKKWDFVPDGLLVWEAWLSRERG